MLQVTGVSIVWAAETKSKLGQGRCLGADVRQVDSMKTDSVHLQEVIRIQLLLE